VALVNPDYIKAVAGLYNQLVDEIARNALPDLSRREMMKALTALGDQATPEQVLSRLSPVTREELLRDALRRFVEAEIDDLEERGIVGYRRQ
jgi:hypothetical protein